MRFNTVFRPSKGGCLASGDWTNIGLDGLDQIRAANPDAKLSAVQPYITDRRWPSITIELSEEIARDCGSLFLNSREIEILVTQNSLDDKPLQRFAHTTVSGTSKTRLVWALNPDDVKFSWLLAGAPLEWDAAYPHPDELDKEIYDEPDDEHEYLGEGRVAALRAATLAKLREGADNLQFDDPDSALRQAKDAAILEIARSWGNSRDFRIIQIDRVLDSGTESGVKAAVSYTNRMAQEHGESLAASLKAQEETPNWKDALLNELSREDACIMVSIEYALAGVPSDVDFDDVLTTPKVREMICDHEGWLSSRQNVVDLLPPLWNDFYKEL